jgi:predicted AAA+ superfamily ATPase
MLPPLVRLPKLAKLIEQETYFVIHAPRQIGKTTTILSLATQLNSTGQYVAAVLSVEIGAPFGDDIGAAELAI